MTAQTAARPALDEMLAVLANAKIAWRMANRRERSHANRCPKLARGIRCGTCLDLEAAQNRAADAVARARREMGAM